jgi:hypothetical protein
MSNDITDQGELQNKLASLGLLPESSSEMELWTLGQVSNRK